MKSLLFFVFSAFLLGACDSENKTTAVPREPDSNAVGFFCHMGLSEHAGPKGQIALKGLAEPLWFSSVHDALSYVAMELTNEKDIAAFWVNDMSVGTWEKPAFGSWIDAQKAWYVIGSQKTASMGTLEVVPFSRKEQALVFIETFGGHLGDYTQAKKSISEETPLESSGDT